MATVPDACATGLDLTTMTFSTTADLDTASDTASDSALDRAALARLAELDPDGTSGIVRRVLSAYESSLTRMLGALEGGPGDAGAPSAKLLFETAHTLKSSSASVGALRLAQACTEIEQRTRDSGRALPHDLARLLAEGRAALTAVRGVLGR